jgi:hypothetical protein
LAAALIFAPSQSPLRATDGAALELGTAVEAPESGDLPGTAGGGTVTGLEDDCLFEFAASDGVFSVSGTAVVPNEDMTLAATGWVPNSPIVFTVTYVPSGEQESGYFPTDSAGEYFELLPAPELHGQWELTAWDGCGATASFQVLPLDDILGSKFLNHIKWLFVEGITSGCSATLYCPNGQVTRGQMATFLVRALHLPATTTDYFTDDEGSVHEPNINRLRAAGITAGCGGSRYCPDGVVTRAQMATFLVRGFDLPATSTDYFTDDEGSIHEVNINRLKEAGITAGCTETTYCPSGAVTRGQMAAFLKRAIE